MGAGASAGSDASQHVSASGTADSKARVKQLHKMRQAARKKSLRNLKSAMQSLEPPQEQLPTADASLAGFAGMKSFRSGAGQFNIGATWSELPKSPFSTAVAASASASAMGSGAGSQEDGKEEESSAGEEKSKDQSDRRGRAGASKKILSDVEVADEGKENEEKMEEKGGEVHINDKNDGKGDDENDREANEGTENKVTKDGGSDMNDDQVESERELREAKEAQANATLDAALDRIAKERESEKRPLKTVVDYSRPPLQDKFENRLWEDMLSYFQGLTEERPEAFWPWYNLAIAMDKRQRHSEAIQYYKGASNARLSRPDVVFRQGLLHVANDLKKVSIGDPKLSGLEAYDMGSTEQARDGRFPQKTLVDEHDDEQGAVENHHDDEEKERKEESKGKEDLDESKGHTLIQQVLIMGDSSCRQKAQFEIGAILYRCKKYRESFELLQSSLKETGRLSVDEYALLGISAFMMATTSYEDIAIEEMDAEKLMASASTLIDDVLLEKARAYLEQAGPMAPKEYASIDR